ncbi:unnamed protein product, partial [Coregonus sp. 'balchen']
MAEEIRRTAALLEQPLIERGQELITYIKHKFATNLKKEHSYLPEKVVTRSDTKYVPIQNGQAKKNYDRCSVKAFSPLLTIVSNDWSSLILWQTHWDKKFGKKSGGGVISSKFTQEKGEHQSPSSGEPNPGWFRKRWPPLDVLSTLDAPSYVASGTSTMQKELQCSTMFTPCIPSDPSFFSADKETVPPTPMSMNQQTLDPEEEENLQRIQYRKQKLFSEKLQWIYMKTNILLKQSHSYYNPPVNATGRLVSLAPDDCHNITPDVYKALQSGPRCKVGQRARQMETCPHGCYCCCWMRTVTSLEKKTVKPRADQSGMLERAKAQYLDVKKVLNILIENREERMRTLFDALMASKTDAGLSEEFTTLQSEATELSGDRDPKYNSMLQKISAFQSFSNKKVPYSKKFCLLVLSMPANQLLRPAMQEALLFLTEKVLLCYCRGNSNSGT